VEAGLERDHRGPARVQPCDLDGVLDRLGAGVEERGAGRAGERCERAEPLGHGDVRLVRDDREVGVHELGCLLLDRLDGAGVAVTDVDDADAAREVDERVAVDVGDGGVERPGGEDGQVHAQRLRDRVLGAREDGTGARARDLGADLYRLRHGHEYERTGARGGGQSRLVDVDDLDPDPHVQLDARFAEASAAGGCGRRRRWLPRRRRPRGSRRCGWCCGGQDERGFTFFTNRESRASERGNPRAALVLYREMQSGRYGWRVVVSTSATASRSRPRTPARQPLRRVGIPQSRPIGRDEFRGRYADVEERFAGWRTPLRPSGAPVVPDAFEFCRTARPAPRPHPP
jgi:hypothetical protein